MTETTRKPEKIGYDSTTCAFLVPPEEAARLQKQYPHDDIETAIKQAGKHTRAYSQDLRERIAAQPARFLKLDLQWQLFRPKPEREPANLAELAGQIRLCPAFIYEVLTGKVNETLAARDLLTFYRPFYELGGSGFEPTDDAAQDLKCLLAACGRGCDLPSVQEIDVRILKYLYATEVPLRQIDLTEKLGESRRTISERLTYLRHLGLTERSPGSGSPDALTTRAKDLLDALNDTP